MRRIIVACLVCLAVRVSAEVQVMFSPLENLERVWVQVINSATNEVRVSCSGITNRRITDALIGRATNGVRVTVCCDRRQANVRGSMVPRLRGAGVMVVLKRTFVLEHNKMVAADGRHGIVGSWNLSESAQSQDNSIVLFLNEPDLVGRIHAAIGLIEKRDRLGIVDE